jgi:hypothetical protein
MGIGDYPAGDDFAGDEIPSVTPSAVRSRPLALQLDPSTRSHVYDASTGRYAELHPVDARVVNTLFIALRKMPGVTNVGAAWDRIYSPWTKDAAAIATDIVRTALADMIRDQSITLRDVRFSRNGAYASFVEVSYTNNRLDSRPVIQRIPIS